MAQTVFTEELRSLLQRGFGTYANRQVRAGEPAGLHEAHHPGILYEFGDYEGALLLGDGFVRYLGDQRGVGGVHHIGRRQYSLQLSVLLHQGKLAALLLSVALGVTLYLYRLPTLGE